MPTGIYKRSNKTLHKLRENSRKNSPFRKGKAHIFYGKPSPVLGKHWKIKDTSRMGHPAWNKGKVGWRKWTDSQREKFRKKTKGHPPYFVAWGKEHPAWKENVKYRGNHMWVYRNLGKPQKCEFCGKEKTTPKSIHWANKSHRYIRDLNDWISLCASCHKKYDIEYRKNQQRHSLASLKTSSKKRNTQYRIAFQRRKGMVYRKRKNPLRERRDNRRRP